MRTIIQSFIRGNDLTVEARDTDDLGRDLGIISMRAPVSPALRAALDEQIAALDVAQEQTIAAARAEVAAGRKPKRLVVDLVQDEADRKAAVAKAAASNKEPTS